MAGARKQPSVVPTLAPRKPVTREELEARRRGVVACAPSGNYYRIRSVNLERHALGGGLPQHLRAIAYGADADKALAKLAEAAAADEGEAGEGEPRQKSVVTEMLEYLDSIVLAVIVEPEGLTREDLGDPLKLDDDALVPGLDYRWLLRVAQGEETYDAEDRQLWGVEPLSRWSLFRDEHACPEDCEGCGRVRMRFSALYDGGGRAG